MNWKTELKLNDLNGTARFEITCKRCHHARSLCQAEIIETNPDLARLYIDEVEASMQCPQRHCRGGVKLDLMHDGKEEGFVGGLA